MAQRSAGYFIAEVRRPCIALLWGILGQWIIEPVLLNSTGDLAAQDGTPYGLYVVLAQAVLDHEVIHSQNVALTASRA
jgi:hypothetical protein